MHKTALLFGGLTILLDTASAHGFVTGIKAGSTWTKGSDPLWYYTPNNRPLTAGWDALNQDIGFVEPNNMGTADINCHKSATPSKLYANVQAGQTIEIYWNTWPSDSHKGPIINYIAPCNGDCTTLTPGALRWSKIAQAGLSNGKWATDPMPTNNFTSTLTIPAKLAAGNYVLRHEIIALHGASNDNGAQLYPQVSFVLKPSYFSLAKIDDSASTSRSQVAVLSRRVEVCRAPACTPRPTRGSNTTSTLGRLHTPSLVQRCGLRRTSGNDAPCAEGVILESSLLVHTFHHTHSFFIVKSVLVSLLITLVYNQFSKRQSI